MPTDPPSFPDPRAQVAPLLAVADLRRSLGFWVTRMGGELLVEWDTYARLRVGEGQIHLAVGGAPPPDRAVRLVPPAGGGAQAPGEVVIQVTDCRAVVARLQERGVVFLGPAAEPSWGGEVRAFALDPDHHLVEITSTT